MFGQKLLVVISLSLTTPLSPSHSAKQHPQGTLDEQQGSHAQQGTHSDPALEGALGAIGLVGALIIGRHRDIVADPRAVSTLFSFTLSGGGVD
jgi:hypothetical protein